VNAAVITVSDRGAAGLRDDKSGPVLAAFLASLPARVVFTRVVPDDPGLIREAFREAASEVGRGVILSTGGTGLSPRDNTPEAVSPLLAARFPGVMEALRRDGRRRTPMASLSRGMAGRVGEALAITLPGSARACAEACEVLGPLLREMLFTGLLV
jgi:molybdenum cofactor synthesis domain-containing protein